MKITPIIEKVITPISKKAKTYGIATAMTLLPISVPKTVQAAEKYGSKQEVTIVEKIKSLVISNFKKIDVDKDLKISKNEFKKSHLPNYSDKEINATFASDQNNDGFLNIDEYESSIANKIAPLTNKQNVPANILTKSKAPKKNIVHHTPAQNKARAIKAAQKLKDSFNNCYTSHIFFGSLITNKVQMEKTLKNIASGDVIEFFNVMHSSPSQVRDVLNNKLGDIFYVQTCKALNERARGKHIKNPEILYNLNKMNMEIKQEKYDQNACMAHYHDFDVLDRLVQLIP